MRLATVFVLALVAGLASPALAQRRSELPILQLYDGARKPEGEVARVRVRSGAFGGTSRVVVQRVAGEEIVWPGASVWRLAQVGVQGPLLGHHAEALELAPGTYEVTIAYWEQATGAVLPGRTVRMTFAPGHVYAINARIRFDARSFNITLQDETADETQTFEP